MARFRQTDIKQKRDKQAKGKKRGGHKWWDKRNKKIDIWDNDIINEEYSIQIFAEIFNKCGCFIKFSFCGHNFYVEYQN